MKKILLKIYFRLRRRLELFQRHYEPSYLEFCHGQAIQFGVNVTLGADFRVTISPQSIAEIGAGCIFRNDNTLTLLDGHLRIGKNNFFNNGCSINCLHFITIGEGNLFGENIRIYDHNHRFTTLSEPINNQGYSLGAITIGNGCWIGSNVVILKGVNIGDNVVIGANNLIYKSIPDGMVVKAATATTQSQRIE